MTPLRSLTVPTLGRKAIGPGYGGIAPDWNIAGPASRFRGSAVPESFHSDRYAEPGQPGFAVGYPILVIHRFQRRDPGG